MKLKRILILTLAFTFLVSTIGLPFYYHYCEMIGKKSLSACQTCAEENEETISCCAMEELDFKIQLKAENSTCCIDEFDYKKIEDNFFQTITSNLIPIVSVITELHLSSIDSQSEIKFLEQTNYDLPPPKFGKQLLNTIHQLKIDLPVC
ncbi:MAG: hypothetical protein MUE91_10325 [Ignavibacteriaceae bacterium]|jgi:hypothetical protein|nr:hypothetical protein [Ignavibacteriaceae bacterium]MCU0414777.1 hypothetical protein [Ignavibacteriaceae bacterium]